DPEEKLGYEALDLLNGKFLSFPRQASADGDWLPPWLETNRVDLIAIREDNRWFLMCVKTKLSDFATEGWPGPLPPTPPRLCKQERANSRTTMWMRLPKRPAW